MTVISVPSLARLLAEAERHKGAPLTREEVEDFNGKTLHVSVPDNIARCLDPFCGYGDVNPQLCWETWLRYRAAALAKTA